MNRKNRLASRILTSFVLLCISTHLSATSINIYAASSMTNVVKALADAYSTKTGITVVPVLASSSSLAKQILAGAPADIYISANTHWTHYLIQEGKINNDDVINIATNQLVVICSVKQPKTLELANAEQWLDYLINNRLAIGDTRAVPAGIYAKEALQTLGLWQSLQGRLAPVSNVRLALILVERGEAPLGIVYRTDALISDKVKIVATFPSSSHTAITYPMAIMNNNVATHNLAEFIQSDQGQSIFKRYGFL
ncbi:molybdate ABC transporter substrate-binding protein [Vibrio pectenicida]|uniref:Molybdate ABC transporter substrate-binding protein n=1 Tax=Vibrio pectenicida TaxID=62763 RepID=A0A7Y4A257_9VIBR|nr:molybdate ABC transporter substrate-binding protein [Vibrio pectenicida]NOH72759.1 molybdate ABC transporter substrate-binding protein [Vibrio pectenicida]